MRKVIYFLLRALRNMRQSPFLCVAAVGTVTVSLVILAFFALIVINVQQLTRHWSRDVQVVAYFDKTPDSKSLDRQLSRIREYPEVDTVAYIAPQQAFKRFQKRLGDDADLLQGMDQEFLPASLEIHLGENYRHRDGVLQVVDRLKQDRAFADLRYGQDWLKRFEAFLVLLRTAGLVLGGFLLFAALFIVSNTIKLTLYARREELEVMALVGGTPAFIKAPFLFEGLMQGVFGGLLALAASFVFFATLLKDDLGRLLLATGLEEISFLPPFWQVSIVLLGGLLGLFGSLFSLRKFVRI